MNVAYCLPFEKARPLNGSGVGVTSGDRRRSSGGLVRDAQERSDAVAQHDS